MLDIKDSLREEVEIVESPSGGYKRKSLIFQCLGGCGKELKKQKSELATSTGKCTSCYRRSNYHPYKSLYNQMVSSVNRTNRRDNRTIEIDLTFEEFLEYTQIKTCFYCSEPNIIWKEYSSGPYNLDRRDNSLGYKKGNIVVCCKECNYKKNRFYNDEEFLLISELMKLYKVSTETERSELLLLLSTARFDKMLERQW